MQDGRDAMGYALDVACPKQDFTLPALLVECGYPIVIKSWTQCRFFLPAMIVAVVYHNYTKAAHFLFTTYTDVLADYVDMVDGFFLQQCIVQNNTQLCTQLCALGMPLLRSDGVSFLQKFAPFFFFQNLCNVVCFVVGNTLIMSCSIIRQSTHGVAID